MKKLLILSMLLTFICPVVKSSNNEYIIKTLGVYAFNLGLIAYKTGDLDPVIDVATAGTASTLITASLACPPKTVNKCYFHMGMHVAAGGLMLGRIWYKLANRPAPAPAPVAPAMIELPEERISNNSDHGYFE
ncbi:hypothetical protein KBB68_02610 [Candidatus Babeliales bacterium]|nr:hypothetical protein [Candidatus Babeliales bacterium]